MDDTSPRDALRQAIARLNAARAALAEAEQVEARARELLRIADDELVASVSARDAADAAAADAVVVALRAGDTRPTAPAPDADARIAAAKAEARRATAAAAHGRLAAERAAARRAFNAAEIDAKNAAYAVAAMIATVRAAELARLNAERRRVRAEVAAFMNLFIPGAAAPGGGWEHARKVYARVGAALAHAVTDPEPERAGYSPLPHEASAPDWNRFLRRLIDDPDAQLVDPQQSASAAA